MKQKKSAKKPEAAGKPAVTPVPAAEVAVSQPAEGLNRSERLEVVLFYVAVFFGLLITNGRMSLILLALCLAFSIRKRSVETLQEHLSLPVIGITCMLLLYGVSAVAIPTDAASVLEFFRGLCVFSIAGFALLRFKKKHIPALLWGFVITMAVLALITLDGGSTGALYNAVTGGINALGGDMSEILPMENQRLNGICNNANVAASLMALAMLLGVYHLQTETDKKRRLAAAMLLGINGVTFWLHLSRGAILCFGASLVVWLVFTKKGERVRLFFLFLASGLPVLGFGFAAQQVLGVGSALPDLLALLCGPVIFLLDSFVAAPLARVLEGKEKVLKIGGAAAACLCIAAVVAALLLTGPYTFREGMPLVRTADLQPGGTYTVSGDWDGDPNIMVRVENKDGLLMDRYEYLYDGPISEAEFTLPADTELTHIWLRGTDGDEIREIVFSDGTALKLDYTLLPEAVEGRLQDPLFKSSSFLLRAQYVKDALKIWKDAPIFGRGLASTDAWYTAVQPFFYQSQFVHNHLVQYLANLGILGLAAFLLVAGGAVWLLLRKWKQERSAFAAVMLAAMTMMHLHSLMEINFSVRSYAVMGYLMMAIVTIGCAEAFPMKGHDGLKRAAVAAAAAYWVVLGVFGGIALSYRIVNRVATEYETTDYENYMSTLDKYIQFDALNDFYYKILYASEGFGDARYAQKARVYAEDLRETGLFTNCDAMARYYYLPQGLLDEMFACMLEGIEQKANDPLAWNEELNFCRTTVLNGYSEAWNDAMWPYLEGVMNIRDALMALNSRQLAPVELTETNQAFLDAVEMLWRTPDMDPDAAYALLTPFITAEG